MTDYKKFTYGSDVPMIKYWDWVYTNMGAYEQCRTKDWKWKETSNYIDSKLVSTTITFRDDSDYMLFCLEFL